MSAKTKVTELFALANIKVGEDIIVHEEGLYDRILAHGSLGFGEAYMDGWWDAPELDDLMYKIIKARLPDKVSPWRMVLPVLSAKLRNKQSKARAFQVGEQHYDTGNDLFEVMLGERMVYTSAYW